MRRDPEHGRRRPTRRDFIGATAVAAAGLAVGGARLALADDGPGGHPLTGVVARAHTPRATVEFAPQQEVVDGMVAAGLMALTGHADAVESLASLFPAIGPEDRILIKPNTMGAPTVAGTRGETLSALARLVRELPTTDGRKVRAEQVTVWDNAPTFAIEEALEGLCGLGGSPSPAEWDLDTNTPLHLPDPPDDAPMYAQRVVIEADHLISVGALKHHPLAATTGSLKNYFGVVDRPWDLHTHGPLALIPVSEPLTLDGEAGLTAETDTGNTAKTTLPAGTHTLEQIVEALGAGLGEFRVQKVNVYSPHLMLVPPEGDEATRLTLSGPLAGALGVDGRAYLTSDVHHSVPALYSLPEIGGKTRLNMVDGLVGLYDNGPYHMAQEFQTFPQRTPNTLLFGVDPVAVDAVMSEVVMKERELHDDLEDASLRPDYLAKGEAMGLGVADPARIRVVDAKLEG